MPAVYLRNFEPYSDELIARQQMAPRVNLQGAFPLAGRAFPLATPRYAYFYGYFPDYVSTPTLAVLWYLTGAQAAGNVTWIANCAAVSPGDAGRLSDKQFAADNSQSTSPTGVEELAVSTVTLTNNNSLAAGDLLVVRVTRDAGNTSCGGTAVIIGVSLNYTGS